MSDANETPAPAPLGPGPSRRSRADRWVKRGFFLVILLTMAVVAYFQLRGPRLGWPGDLNAALAKAKAEKRKVLVFVGKFPSNVDIQRMVGNTIPKNKAAWEGKFILVEINLDGKAAWAKKYGVTRAPTMLLIAPDGESFYRQAGVIGETDFAHEFLVAPLRRGGPPPEPGH